MPTAQEDWTPLLPVVAAGVIEALPATAGYLRDSHGLIQYKLACVSVTLRLHRLRQNVKRKKPYQITTVCTLKNIFKWVIWP